MATYTQITHEALERFLYMFDVGELDRFEAISDGIENSNYFVWLKDNQEQFVLTITEGLEFEDVPFFNDLLQVLSKSGLCVPSPQRTLDGMSSTIFKGKPTWLFDRLSGSHIAVPTSQQCFEIGSAMATIHTNVHKVRYHRENAYDANWALASLQHLRQSAGKQDIQLLERTVAGYLNLADTAKHLPRGIIHGDLFRDNALFEGDTLTGVIDFYHACEDYFVLDIAVTANDWCLNGVDVDQGRLTALIDGYETVRQLEAEERHLLDDFRLFAAMRFALTRMLAGRSESTVKNPREFLDLMAHLESSTTIHAT